MPSLLRRRWFGLRYSRAFGAASCSPYVRGPEGILVALLIEERDSKLTLFPLLIGSGPIEGFIYSVRDNPASVDTQIPHLIDTSNPAIS